MSKGTGAPKNSRRLILSVLATMLGALAFTAAPALAAAPETPENEKVSAVTATTAKLEGELNPKATVGVEGGEYEFEYRVSETECEGESVAPEPGTGIAAGLPKEAESVSLTGLQPHQKYSFCLIERNAAAEEAKGVPVSFETKVAAPSIAAPPSTSITPTEARLEGLVNPNNQSTECHVQYGTDASLATKTTAECEPETLAGYGYQGSLTLSGLTQATTYYYRVIAKNASGKEEGAIEHFTTGTPEPPETGQATPVEATEATLKGVLNPRHAGEAGTYEFVYRKSATECQGGEPGEEKKAPEPAETATGHSPEPVEATITGLLPGMPYTFCLIAKNAAEEAAVGTPVTFTTLAVAPTITSESVSTVEAAAATLEAEIDPGGASTTYHFEYLTEAQFNANGGTFSGATGTAQSASIGSGDTSKLASARIPSSGASALAPATTYHYRVVATNVKSPAGGTPGPNKTFTTSPAPGSAPAQSCPNEHLREEQPYGLTLPDCRAYEMVSPPNTNGNDATKAGAASSARASEAPTGSEPAITYPARGSFGDPTGALEENQYVSRRTPTGWSTQAVTPLSSTPAPGLETRENNETSYPAPYFTPELTAGLALSSARLNGAPPLQANNIAVYVANFATELYEYVGETSQYGNEPPWGASRGLERVVLSNPENGVLLEWVNGTDVPVSISNGGQEMEASAGSSRNGSYETEKDAWHATSEDGSRVYFTANGQLDVRVNIDQPHIGKEQSELNANEECTEPTTKACTITISAGGARYWGANAEGTKVFYTENEDLYEYSLPPGQVSGGQRTAITNGGGVQGVAQISNDGQYVYFVANGVLTNTANAQGELAKPGNCNPEGEGVSCNLYVSHEGGEPVFVTTLAAKDITDWHEGGSAGSADAGPETNTAVVNPAGSQLAFTSERSLPAANFPAGYDNEQAEPGQCETEIVLTGTYETGGCREIYLYNTETHGLACASCNPTGARPVGPASIPGVEVVTKRFGDYRPRDFLADGSLFFDSKDALAPGASGGGNVYEYEDGEVHAISNAAGGQESFFLDASPDGKNVFFVSADKLLPEDPGGNAVVWDAREDGGFPVAAPACTTAEACRNASPSTPFVYGPPPSATFSGPGNLAPPAPAVVKKVTTKKPVKCKRGYVKKKVKKKETCVKKKSKKKAKRAINDRRASK